MTKYVIIPPTYGEGEFYDYLYKIVTSTSNLARIPDKFFEDVIEYYESVENYERCAELQRLQEKKNKLYDK